MSRSDAAHLLRRAGFGGSVADVDAWAARTREQAVDRLLDTSLAPPAPDPAFLNDSALADWEKHTLAQKWWLDRMATTPAPLIEKMALFWHGHFPSAQDSLYDIRLLHAQSQLFRRHALGNYRDLVQAVSVDPAMLIYLDNATNRAGREQENFARELMELFTLGVGNYTEADVVAAAKAWTGHNLGDDRRSYLFRPGYHDNSTKTLFGIARNWDGPGVVDEILRGSKRDVAARFIVAKLWRWFVSADPPAGVVDTLAAQFVAGNLEVAPLLRSILLHDLFWADANRHALVRPPVDWVVACIKSIGMGADQLNPQWWMARMGQQLYNPPSVEGWKQNGYWISTAAYWARAGWGRYARWRALDSGALTDFTGLGRDAAVQAALDRFGLVDVSPTTRGALAAFYDRQNTSRLRWSIPVNLLFLPMVSPEMNVQ